jgi:site-specific DNA-methyltransferase (adenine-specific)
MMKSLPDSSIDMICTDVAYESLEKHRKIGTTTRLKVSEGSSNEWFEIFKNERFVEFFEEAYRVMKKNSHLYFFCDGETSRVAVPIGENAKFHFWNEIVWVKTTTKPGNSLDKSIRIGLGFHYRRSKEYILFFEKGKKKLNNLSISDVLPFPPVSKGYPTEKPVELIKILINQSTMVGDVVLDPFMGSGSAGVAATSLGRSFIGNDIKKSAVELARQRLSSVVQP